MSDLICIKTYINREEAELARGFLETNGVGAAVFADDCGGARPHLQIAGVRLMVGEEDVEKATQLLKEVVEKP